MRPLRRCGGRHPIMSPSGSDPAAAAEPSNRAHQEASMLDGRHAQAAHRTDRQRVRGALAVHGHLGLLRPPEPATAGASSSAARRSRKPSTRPKIMDFLIDNEIEFDLPGRSRPSTTRYESAARGRRRERSSRSGTSPPSSTAMASRAPSAGDHRGHQFLQWFIEEQVEEEAKLQSIARPHRQRHQPVPGRGAARPLRVSRPARPPTPASR